MNKIISLSPSRLASILILAFSVGLILPIAACTPEKAKHTKVVKYPKKQKLYKQDKENPVQVLVQKFSKYLP